MKNDAVYLHHILDAINRIEQYLAGVSYDRFLQDVLLQDGVVRQMEIIGEAARNVSKDLQNAHPELPWGKMIGVRNILTHAYFRVDLFIVWDTAQSDLPRLKQQIEQLLEEMGENDCEV
ncbi:MAG: DUF86 domain-containing protein [Anaerolineae bacterium]